MPHEKLAALLGMSRMPPVFLSGWLADYPAAANFHFNLLEEPQSPSGSGTSYSDKDVDRLLSPRRSTTDVGRRYDLDRRAAAEIMADLPLIPLIEFIDFRLLSTGLAGFSVDPLCGVDTRKLWVE